MSYKFLGTYKGYKVYTGARHKDDVPYSDPGTIYLVPTGNGDYWMMVNGRICGKCDSRYCVEEFEEPQIEELNFTSSSWTTDPNPQVLEEEPKEEAKQEPQPTATSSDFWTRVQEDIDSVLKSTAI